MAASDSDNRPKRRMRGFEPAAGLLRGRIRAAGESRGFAVSRLVTHWAEVVGTDIAALCRPVKVGYGRAPEGEGLGATLTLLASSAAAPLVQMRLPAIRAKVNACYGYNAISRITVTQTSATMAPADFAEDGAAYEAPPPCPDPRLEARASALTEGVTDPGLRAALEGIARHILKTPPALKG